jgi:hypothetical protein
MYFVSLFQPIDFMCKTVCSVPYTSFYLRVVHQCLSDSLTHFGYNLFVYKCGKDVADGCTSRLWPRAAMLSLLS